MRSFYTSPLSRRRLLKNAGLLGIASTCPPLMLAAESHSSATPQPAIQNHAPLAPNAFYALPLGSIRARGWLLQQLQTQANGLGGHLDETWPDVGPDSGWLGGKGESWERGPYFLDGLVPLAWLLDDAKLKAKAQKFIDWTLSHQQPNGMIGPASNDDWWPRFVILKVLTQYHELTGDPRVIPLMDRYFRYQLAELPRRPLRDWGKFRWQDAVLSVVWLYNRTQSTYLLDLARLLRTQGHDWMAQYANFQYTTPMTAEILKLSEGQGLQDLALSTHGVNNGQAVKAGPIWSMLSGAEEDRNAAARMIAELNQYHGLPNGIFSCDEHLAGLDPVQGSELCTVVEYMFSLEQSLAITGNAAFGDRLEQLAFNALPGAFSDDMWSHQYNQEPNQVECSLHHKPWTTDGPESNLYGLEPNFGCCTANFHQGWPKFANSLFLLSPASGAESREGIVAAAYAPSEANLLVNGVPLRIIEETDYPFRETIRFTLHPATPALFPLRLRIPAWATGARITVNGKPEASPSAGSFARLERTWKPGDQVELTLPMQPRLSRWFHNSVAIERGPLLFSYGIAESWVKLRDRGLTADWQVFPAGEWNYALQLNASAPERSISVAENPLTSQPFSRRQPPVELRVKARKLDSWRAEDGVANTLPVSPVKSQQPEETIALIPYAAAKLRITAFPLLA